MRIILTALVFVVLSGMLAADVHLEGIVPAPTHDPLTSLTQGLHAKEASARIRAADALGKLGAQAVSAAWELVEALDDPDNEVRNHVVDALAHIGPAAFRSLARAVKRGTTERRLLAFHVFTRIAGSGNYIIPESAFKDISPALFDCLRDEDPDIRNGVIECLRWPGNAASVTHLLKLLEREEDPYVRGNAIVELSVYGEESKRTVPVLERIAVTEYNKKSGGGYYDSLGGIAAATLAHIGEPAAPALARLVANVKLSADLRCDALHAVGMQRHLTHGKFTTVVPTICKALADREEKVRLMAIYALSPNGSSDPDVIAALQTAITDKSPRVRIDAAVALHGFDPQNKAILPTIFQTLDHKEAGVRERACGALEQIGSKAEGAIPKLVQLMSHEPDDSARLAAVKALGRMGPGIVSAIPVLTLATNDPNQYIREAAQESLKQAKEYAMKRP